MDSGAGKCGTSNLALLKNVTACQGITVNGAFGPSVNPAHIGTFGPLNLPAVHIDGMGSQALVSLSQFCAGGTTGTKYIGVFTPTEYRMYEMQSALSVLSTLARTGKEAERGRVQNGIYVRESTINIQLRLSVYDSNHPHDYHNVTNNFAGCRVAMPTDIMEAYRLCDDYENHRLH